MHRYRLPQVEHQGFLGCKPSHLKKPYVNHIDFNTIQHNKYNGQIWLWIIGIHLIVWSKLIIFFPHFTMSNGKRRFHRHRITWEQIEWIWFFLYETSKSQIIHYKLRRFTLKMYEFAHQVAIDMQIDRCSSRQLFAFSARSYVEVDGFAIHMIQTQCAVESKDK